jgi:hypothetical protein
MPQHLWEGTGHVRTCEVCAARQSKRGGDWAPEVHPICHGDDEDDGSRGWPRRRPNAPAGSPRVLELA